MERVSQIWRLLSGNDYLKREQSQEEELDSLTSPLCSRRTRHTDTEARKGPQFKGRCPL
jgi:hypothetical protein